MSSTIHTPDTGLRQGLFDLPATGTALKAYFARPDSGGDWPIALVVQEIFGINDHIQDVCRRFAQQGYFAVAVNLFQRLGDPESYTDVAGRVKDLAAQAPDDQVMDDLDASVKWAAEHGADASRVTVSGFCWGGRIAWLYAAHNPSCKAATAWYGRLTKGHGDIQVRHPIGLTDALYGPVLGLYGGRDTSIPLEDVNRMRESLSRGNAAAQASRIDVYDDAGHAFFADYRPSYRADDAEHAWREALDWLARYV
jgi:carboxymethylenebutenolidase